MVIVESAISLFEAYLEKVDILITRYYQRMFFREPILRITDTSDGTFLACSQDGLVSFWTPNMDLKRTRTVQVSSTCDPTVTPQSQIDTIRSIPAAGIGH